MGIPGILKEIGKGERVALSKLAIEHLERTNRPLRIAIDAAIWNFQNQASQGGKNPALRTLFFKLLKLLALPIHPVFVYDGRNKPLTKRGKTVSRYGTCIENEKARQLLSTFRFPHHTAPGEAEAECAFLQKRGIVDAVMSQDVDAIMFGSTLTLRDWSKEGTKGNKTPTHVNVLDLPGIKRISGLDPDGMVLVALLSGGDYDETGVPGFGSTLACEIARAGFGSDLLELIDTDDQEGLREWRDRLQYELQTNESGYFRTKHSKLKVPEDFPNATVLSYYMKPAVSKQEDLPELEDEWSKEWKAELDILALRKYTASNFDWNRRSGARSFVRRVAQPLFQSRLLRGTIASASFSVDHISDVRQHFTNDGIEELRLMIVPAEAVEIDLEMEEENPEYTFSGTNEELTGPEEPEAEEDPIDTSPNHETIPPKSPSKRQRPPWNPYDSEKWWIPQTLLQLGLPLIVEQWQQKQRDILADPRKFATRKCTKTMKSNRAVGVHIKAGTLRSFLVEQPGNGSSARIRPSVEVKGAPKALTKTSDCVVVKATPPSMLHYFQASRTAGGIREKTTKAAECQKIPAHATHGHLSSASSFSDHPSLKHPADTNPDSRNTSESEMPAHKLKNAVFNLLPSYTANPTVPQARDDEPQLSYVTQRRKRRQKPLQTKTVNESSFKSMHRPLSKSHSSKLDENMEHRRTLMQDDLRSTSQGGPSEETTPDSRPPPFSSRVTVMPRDSLPGAWRKTGADSAQGNRGPRVSYIDLTGD